MSKQPPLPFLPAAAFWLLSLPTRPAPAHVPRKDSGTVPPPPTMVLPAGEALCDPHTYTERVEPVPGCLPGQTLGPELTRVTMVTPRAEGQVLLMLVFLQQLLREPDL